MITELFLYDREKGLFKEILNKSKVMKGHYHVSPNFGKDLNTDNLETFIKDPKNGLIDVPEKYPLCVCMTPRSKYVFMNGTRWEQFVFNLFFVTTTFYTADNQIKSLDVDTNTSAHHIWYDWQDMKTCAMNFLEVLKEQTKRAITIDGNTVPLKSVMNIDIEGAVYKRLTKVNNDRLSGIDVSFLIYLDASQCTIDDYADVDIFKDIVLPPLDIHPLHQQ